MTRPRATPESTAALHRHTGARHDTFPVCLSLAELHLINRVREDVAARFNMKVRDDGMLPAEHRQLEAMDALCDQLGLEDGPHRQRAREAGAHEPWSAERVARFIGEDVRVEEAA